ncbi:MAG: ABC transporter substrate-binding protein [Eubacteriales bacterium]|jgi:putative ABC transport system substrate-binding protein|nr:ABC transporter substrate-binding protein [Lachnospiraceae bacterium]MDD5859736.1 ABC transporter substrate-binding protein [Eubacteriales bacterium]MCH4063215.1 ABC transporter substrate-binding protein [Lachnospiraceae bacterium]MCH4105038.1 ABC transporter substrate-binding protein [Lachnospiraceae bacterium]MCI1308496.1 ABC transporter substrate-binding protein [Lachnospiraceae bacterium]
MKMRRFMAAAVSAAMAVGLAACGSSSSTASSSANATSAASGASGKTYKIGICQLVQHNALDAATQGFEDALTKEFGDNVKIDLQNAQGDSTTCATIVNGFVSNNYDLIMANATPALQAAVSATSTIPILGTSVTDYGTALSMDNFSGTTGLNVSGTSDLAPLDQQEAMIKELVPNVKKVAIVYCSAEANSEFQAQKIEGYLKDDGIAYQEYTFADSNDIQSVVQSAVSDCDAMYIPTDNTAASNMTLVKNITEPAKIPVICGEENMCKAGGLATLSISYYDLGYQTGKMAIDILENGTDPSTMAIQYASATTKEYNADYAKAIGFTMPDGYTAIGSDDSSASSTES